MEKKQIEIHLILHLPIVLCMPADWLAGDGVRELERFFFYIASIFYAHWININNTLTSIHRNIVL